MKNILPLLILVWVCIAANAQQALGPGTGLVSPEINPDNTVTFRYFGPKAIKVEATPGATGGLTLRSSRRSCGDNSLIIST